MSTRVHMILEALWVSFGMTNRCLEDHKGVHMEVKGSSGSSTKKKKKNTKKKFRKKNKIANSSVSDSFVPL